MLICCVFSPHLCVGFLFLVVPFRLSAPACPRPPAAFRHPTIVLTLWRARRASRVLTMLAQHTTRCGDASVPNAQGRVQETDYIVSGRGRWFSVKPTHPRDDQVPVWRRGRRRCLCGRRGTWRHWPSLCVEGVALGDIDRHFAWRRFWWHAWFPVGTVVAAALCVGGVALGDVDVHSAWQAWRLVTSSSTLRGRRGTYGTRRTALSPTTLSHTHNFVTHNLCHTQLFRTQLFHTSLSHAQLCHPQLCHTQSFTHLSHMQLLSHTHLCHTRNFATHTQLCHTQLFHTQLCHRQLCHTQLCHTQLFHTQLFAALSQTIFHTQLCHTQLFHTQLCHTHTIFHTQLCHKQLCHTQLFHTQLCHRQPFTHNSFTHDSQSFTHNSFTHNLSHTSLSHTHNFLTHNSSPTTSERIDPPPSPLSFLLSPCRFNHLLWLLEELGLWGYPVL